MNQDPLSSPAGMLRWSFNRLGPFYRLQRRLRLVSDTDLMAGRRALVFSALAFVPALLLAWAGGHLLDPKHQLSFLHDFSVYAMVIAIAAFVFMEQSSDRRMRLLLNNFVRHDLLPDSARPAAERARQRMERRTGTAWVEALLLVAAYLVAYEWLYHLMLRVDGGTWAGRIVDGRPHFTGPGWWAVAVTMPLFLFLLGRWLWRFITWGLLLRDLSRCELRLVATHADRCGGLAFIGEYPSTYMLFVFSVSTMVSAGVLKQVVLAGVDILAFKYAAIGVVVFLALAFILPLTAFTPTLLKLKRRGLRLYGGLISRHNQAFEDKWCGIDPPEETLGAPDFSSLADLSASYGMVKSMLPLPLTKEGILPLLGAVLLPMVVVAATQVPVKEVLEALKGMVLL